ncbi:hypothetical protein EYF80_018358 [Liparis tanakae]|uniref:Uncharacterized protein n=1 Tax=Liparis tanakae TaxID=230148 RepID=A0A4Z2HZY8_9TELE|nr:hypothetical protein EYF80_018358 [Liparis tanakae]
MLTRRLFFEGGRRGAKKAGLTKVGHDSKGAQLILSQSTEITPSKTETRTADEGLAAGPSLDFIHAGKIPPKGTKKEENFSSFLSLSPSISIGVLPSEKLMSPRRCSSLMEANTSTTMPTVWSPSVSQIAPPLRHHSQTRTRSPSRSLRPLERRQVERCHPALRSSSPAPTPGLRQPTRTGREPPGTHLLLSRSLNPGWVQLKGDKYWSQQDHKMVINVPIDSRLVLV